MNTDTAVFPLERTICRMSPLGTPQIQRMNRALYALEKLDDLEFSAKVRVMVAILDERETF